MTYNKNTWANHDLITSQKLNNIEDGINDVIDRVTYGTGGAEQPTQPIHTPVYLNLGDPLPTDAVSGDYAFIKDGDDFTIMEFNGVKWVEQINPNLKERIADVLTQAETRSKELVDENAKAIGATLDDVKAKQADLTAQQAELDTKAQGYANKALADAKADTLATATQTAKDAPDALATAKTDLTTSLNKEVTDRANAVTALDTKAKGYADTAKADAISAGATADGVINKKIDDTASSITSTISQNKADADGKITTAQSTATQALNGLATKVSQTVYDAKTGQLQTDLNTTTATANQAKTDIVAIKSKNDSQDARMTTIESDANGVKTTVSNLQTDLGKANGSITTLQQRADGFDATVTKVNNLQVGGRNLYIISMQVAGYINGSNGTITAQSSTNKEMSSDYIAVLPNTAYTFQAWGSLLSGQQYWAGIGQYDTNKAFLNRSAGIYSAPTVATATPNDYEKLTFTTGSNPYFVRVSSRTFSNYKVKFELGNMQTDWTPAPEDVDSATAKAQLTADNATLSINNYKTDADGRISKAQADIIVNANAITTKVSQSDYNAKTGDLTTKVNTAQSTADSATSTIGAYKTSNDARVASAESKITANATAITQKVSQTDYNTKTGQIDGQISTINQTAGQISQSVSNVKAQVDGLSVGGRNLYINTTQVQGYINGSDGTIAPQNSTNKEMVSDYIPVLPNTQYILQAWGSLISGQQYWAGIGQYGANKAFLNRIAGIYNTPTVTSNVANDYEKTMFTTSANTYFVRVSSRTFGNYKIKFEKGNIPTDWSPAPEDTDNKISTVSQTVDSISSIVSDPATGLTKRVQTAEGSISTVQSNVSDLQSKQTQTASGLTTEISNRQTGDTNTLTQAKDFTTSSISNSESGMKSLITQTSDSIIAKVDTKTDSATVLSLLKDNWSIGIADNAGAITNGIVGNSTNMSLISNNVVINAPSTQIKGTAWINSAMIGNGAIGTAQIGDVSITSAKIASLDVAKLTGNVSSFIQSNWNGIYSSVAIDGSGMKITTGGTVTTLDQWGTHWSRGNLNSLYGFGYWQDSSGKNTSSTGLYLGVTGSDNAFINILGTNGAAAAILAGSNFDYGANVNIVQGAFNFYTHVNIRERLQFKGNKWSQPSYIEINENNRTFNFFTGAGLASVGNYFYFNQNVISAGTFSSTSVLSKKIVDSPYTEDALGEISKTQLVNFAYKNRPDQNHVSPIIDDVNDTKEYYIPKTIVGQNGEYVDMYSMISMAWKALQQVNDRLEKLESR